MRVVCGLLYGVCCSACGVWGLLFGLCSIETRCSLLVAIRVRFVAPCSLLVVRYALLVVCGLLSVGRCSLCVVRCVMFVGCCLLFDMYNFVCVCCL